jgi:serine protease Do
MSIRRMASKKTTVLGLGVLIGAAGYGSFVAVDHSLAESPDAFASASEAPRTARPDLTDPAISSLSTAFADLAEATTPAVVQIEVREPGTVAAMPGPEQIPEQFRRFFQLPEGGRPQTEPAPRYGGGTGFIVSKDGYIVTNNHVAGDADEITVTLNDRRTFHAELVGSDPTTDVAVIKIDAKDLPVLPWGSSADLRVGEWVMAIGNPGFSGAEQLDYTVTTGIVSAKDRPLRLIGRSLAEDPDYGSSMAPYAIESFIQTDAVINPGNSGGPMINLKGEVVGVNSAIASTDGRFQGYGFSIPADLVRRVANDLIENGHVLRPWLGVSVVGVSPEDAEVYGLPGVVGVLIQTVTEGSPADDAGLLQEDVIVSVDGTDVTSGGNLQEIIAERRQHDKVALDIYRGGKLRTVKVELGEAPIMAAESGAKRDAPRHATERLGLEIGELTPSRAGRLGFERAHGALVTQVEPMGPAARRGIGPGLLVTKVNGKKVGDAAAASRELDKVDSGDIVSLVVEGADGQSRVVNVRAR